MHVAKILDLLDRLPDFAFALVVLAGSLGPVAVVGVVIFTVTEALF